MDIMNGQDFEDRAERAEYEADLHRDESIDGIDDTLSDRLFFESVELHGREVAKKERERDALRGGDPVRLRWHDRSLTDMRFDLADMLLERSKRLERAGDHEGALAAAREHAAQQHLAETVEARLGRADRF